MFNCIKSSSQITNQKRLLLLKQEDNLNDHVQNPSEYLTQEEVMEMCRVKAKSTLWNWSKLGILVPRASAGRRPLYRYEDVIEFLNRRNGGQSS